MVFIFMLHPILPNCFGIINEGQKKAITFIPYVFLPNGFQIIGEEQKKGLHFDPPKKLAVAHWLSTPDLDA